MERFGKETVVTRYLYKTKRRFFRGKLALPNRHDNLEVGGCNCFPSFSRHLEQIQQKCIAVLRPDLRKNKELESFR